MSIVIYKNTTTESADVIPYFYLKIHYLKSLESNIVFLQFEHSEPLVAIGIYV